MGRNTQGVKIMRMKDATSKVSAFTVVPHDDGEETQAPEEVATEAQEGEVSETAAPAEGNASSDNE